MHVESVRNSGLQTRCGRWPQFERPVRHNGKGDKIDQMKMMDASYTGCIEAGSAANTSR